MLELYLMKMFKSPVSVERVLDYYYNVSPSEMGIKSNFSSMVAQLQAGGPTPPDPWQDFEQERHLHAAERNREIYNALAKIDGRDRNILEQAYECRVYDEDLLEFFGDRRIGVALSTPMARAAAGEHQTVLEFFKTCDDEDLLQCIRQEADDALFVAQKAFEHVYNRA